MKTIVNSLSGSALDSFGQKNGVYRYIGIFNRDSDEKYRADILATLESNNSKQEDIFTTSEEKTSFWIVTKKLLDFSGKDTDVSEEIVIAGLTQPVAVVGCFTNVNAALKLLPILRSRCWTYKFLTRKVSKLSTEYPQNKLIKTYPDEIFYNVFVKSTGDKVFYAIVNKNNEFQFLSDDQIAIFLSKEVAQKTIESFSYQENLRIVTVGKLFAS